MTGYAKLSNTVYHKSGAVNKKRHGVLVRKFIRELKRDPSIEYRVSCTVIKGDYTIIEYWRLARA